MVAFARSAKASFQASLVKGRGTAAAVVGFKYDEI